MVAEQGERPSAAPSFLLTDEVARAIFEAWDGEEDQLNKQARAAIAVFARYLRSEELCDAIEQRLNEGSDSSYQPVDTLLALAAHIEDGK